MNSIHQMMLCAKFGLKKSSGSGGEDVLNFVNVVLFCYYLPLEKGVVIHLNLYPLHSRMLCVMFG